MDKTSLGDRMKGYEKVSRTNLTRRTPVIIRVDGKNFRTFTKRFKNLVEYGVADPKHHNVVKWSEPPLEKIRERTSPFDDNMYACMASTSNLMTHFIQNSCFAYTQSDEISLLLVDWKKFETDAWYGNQVQKMASVAASMATAYFYNTYQHLVEMIDYGPHMPMFDARVFTLPKEEVANYFIWRQQDATRNSINMLGQFYFSHKQLHGKKTNDVQDMLMETHGVNWNDIPTWQKRGFCTLGAHPYSSAGPYTDEEIPIFTKDREYIEQWLDPEYEGFDPHA